MAKVRPRPVPFPANASGGQLWTYPAFSAAAQETRDGGGTWEGTQLKMERKLYSTTMNRRTYLISWIVSPDPSASVPPLYLRCASISLLVHQSTAFAPIAPNSNFTLPPVAPSCIVTLHPRLQTLSVILLERQNSPFLPPDRHRSLGAVDRLCQ